MPDSKFELGDEVYIEKNKPGFIVNKSYGLFFTRQQMSGLEIPEMKWSYQIVGTGFDSREWYLEDTLTKS